MNRFKDGLRAAATQVVADTIKQQAPALANALAAHVVEQGTTLDGLPTEVLHEAVVAVADAMTVQQAPADATEPAPMQVQDPIARSKRMWSAGLQSVTVLALSYFATLLTDPSTQAAALAWIAANVPMAWAPVAVGVVTVSLNVVSKLRDTRERPEAGGGAQ